MKVFSVHKATLLIFFLVAMMIIISGCSAMETLSSLKARFQSDTDPVDQPAELPPEITIPEIPETNLVGETREITLYFADSLGQSLVAEQRLIPKTISIARATVNELIAGPHPETGLLPTIPYGTVLQDINVKDDGLIIVDFSRELRDHHLGGDLAEALTVYSIVNTLTQFPTVERVRFLIDGQPVDTLAGSIDLSRDIYPDTALVSGEGYRP
ncbi:MAG: GerMN domain-containing protein [Clostridia bacterium]|nr:GerMN domain-containing protein [Clostridia bacterium]